MDELGKNPQPYRGIFFAIFFLAFVPLGTFTLVYAVFKSYNDVPEDVLWNICFALAGLIGTLFNIICISAGLFKDLIRPMFERIRDLFEAISLRSKYAFKNYISSFYEDGGILLWIMILWIVFCAVMSVYGFINLAIWFQTL